MPFISLLLTLLLLVPGLAHAAFPVVATTNTTADTDGTTTAINMPASISAGDLLICWDTNDATGTPRSQSGGSDWTRIGTGANGSVISMAIFAKIAAGGDTLTLAGAAQDAATVCARITDHGVSNVSVDILLGTAATGTDAAPDPPTVTHGGPQDYLVLESAHSDDDDDTATYWSTNYSAVNQVQSASSTTSCLTSVGQRSINGTSENPGTMALAATEEWVAQTLSVPPVQPTLYEKFADAFTRADNTDLGAAYDAGYTSFDANQIVSNKVRALTVNVASADSYNGSLGAVQYAESDVATLTGAQLISEYVCTRFAAPTTFSGYCASVLVNGGGVSSRIGREDSGAETSLSENNTITWAATDRFRLFSNGTRHTLSRKPSGGSWTSVLTAVDGTYTSGRTGLGVYVATSGSLANGELDNFASGDDQAPAGACNFGRALLGVGC